jgi:thioredoxin-related protein
MKMKPVIFILALILSNVLMAQDQKIKWYSFEEAVALNKENPKKLFIDLYTDWCGWCKRMDQTTFKNAEIVKFMNDNYYPVKFNAETTDTLTFKGQVYTNPFPMKKRSTHKLAVAMLGQRISYPSYAFLDGGSNMITVVPGYLKADQFEKILNYISENKYKNVKFEDYVKTFKGKVPVQP